MEELYEFDEETIASFLSEEELEEKEKEEEGQKRCLLPQGSCSL
jgi:hypothetical protein